LPCGASANLAARRERFESVGGFDESLRTNEDADLCWRVQYAGGSFGWIEDAVVRYRWRSTLASHARQTYRWGRDTGALVRAHRAHGLRPSISAGLRELVGALVRVPVFVFVPARRWNAAGSIARTWGRTVASVRERVWTLGA
jgi:cellulose synthase/poly-beta-1,6-N-acetylglucosamine synthase-like glycosyltransferase